MLYHLPNLVLVAITAAGSIVAVLLAGMLGRLLPRNPERSAGALEAYKVITTFTAVLLSFSLVQAMGNLRDASTAASREAGALNQLDRVLLRYGGPETTRARTLLKQYVDELVHTEWPMMQAGQSIAGGAGRRPLAPLNRAVQTLEGGVGSKPQLYAEMLKQLDSVNDSRQERVGRSTDGVPAVLWEATFTLYALLVCLSALVQMPSRTVALGGHLVAVAVLATLVFAVDKPYRGQTAVGPEPLEQLQAVLRTRTD